MSRKGFDESSLGTSWSSEPFSSGLSTPFGSEIGSIETESEDEDFMTELTRQMANYMLDEDDEENSSTKSVSEHTEACDSPAKWSGCNSTSTYYCDQRFMTTSTHPTASLNIEVYQLKNQPPVKQESYTRLGRRLTEMNESAKQPKHHHHHHRQNQVIRRHGGNSLSSPNGSGMRAVFLGGSGSRYGSSGTGVFLPRVVDNNYRTEPKKRPGCSTVLIPARVLQALESHFNNMDALSKSNGCGGCTNRSRRGETSEETRNSQTQTLPASNNQEMQLPEDWTY